MVDLDKSLEDLCATQSDKFTDLVIESGLDKSNAFIGADLRDMVFNNETLSGYDFENADFRGSTFVNTVFVNSYVGGAKFDVGIDISLDPNLTINTKDPEFDNIAKIVSCYRDLRLAKDRSDALRELLLKHSEKESIRSYVRKMAINDKAISVPKSLKSILIPRDSRGEFKYYMDIMNGENSYRHRASAFLGAYNSKDLSSEESFLLHHFLAENLDVAKNNIKHIINDKELVRFICARLCIKLQSNHDNYTAIRILHNICESETSRYLGKTVVDFVLSYSPSRGETPTAHWQVCRTLYGMYFSDTNNKVGIYDAIIDILSRSTSIDSLIPEIIPIDTIFELNLSHTLWEWFLSKCEPEEYGPPYNMYSVNKWFRAPYNYRDAEFKIISEMISLRKSILSPRIIDSSLSEYASKFNEYEDIFDIIKLPIFGIKPTLKYLPHYYYDDDMDRFDLDELDDN